MRTPRQFGSGRSSSPSGAVRRRRRPGIVAVAVLTGLLGSGAFVWHSTEAAFTSTTSNASSWSTGSVTISDDDSSGALFNVSGIVPGATAVKCIKVDYTGSIAAAGIKLYATSVSDSSPSLAAQINLTVEEGTIGGSGTFASCAGFSASSTLYNAGLLSTFNSTYTSYANGLSSWAPASAQSRAYRFTYTLSGSAPDTVQGKTLTETFQWEARSA